MAMPAKSDRLLGFDLPDEGTEDYETWQSRAQELEGIESIEDVLGYAESYVPDLDSFLAEWGLAR